MSRACMPLWVVRGRVAYPDSRSSKNCAIGVKGLLTLDDSTNSASARCRECDEFSLVFHAGREPVRRNREGK